MKFRTTHISSRVGAQGLLATLLVFLQISSALADDEARDKEIFRINDDQCQSGNMVACTTAGTLYLEGSGVPKDISKAINYFYNACDKDGVLACSNLAVLYYSGDVVAKDYGSALKYSRKACDLKGPDEAGIGCLIFASLLFEGRSVDKDTARVPFLLKNACKQKSAQGCEDLGALYKNGENLNENAALASIYLGQACELGRQESCSHILWGLLNEVRDSFPFATAPQNYSEVQVIFQQACQSSSAPGCYGLGKLYFMSNDNSSGPSAWQKACDVGEARACYDLGVYKRAHVYSNTSITDAIPYFEKACENGVSESCHMLGDLHTEYSYTFGMSVPNKEKGITPSNQSAINFFAKACDSGYSQSCYNLGVHYFEGVGTGQDYSKAANLFQRGCNDGLEATSCYNSGYMYSSGLGVEEDVSKANRYYLLACDAGHKLGCREVGRD
jgi:uncharacterized protein